MISADKTIRVIMAAALLAFAWAKLANPSSPGAVIHDSGLAFGVAGIEVLVAIALASERWRKWGLAAAVVFGTAAIAVAALDPRPCGCGGDWLHLSRGARVLTMSVLSGTACWLLAGPRPSAHPRPTGA